MRDEFESDLEKLVLEGDIEVTTKTDPIIAKLFQALAEQITELKERVDLLTQFSPLHNEDYD